MYRIGGGVLRGVLGARFEFELEVRVVAEMGRGRRRGKRWWGIDRGRGMMLSLFGLTEFGLISSVDWMDGMDGFVMTLTTALTTTYAL